MTATAMKGGGGVGWEALYFGGFFCFFKWQKHVVSVAIKNIVYYLAYDNL